MSELAEYECTKKCFVTVGIDADGNPINKMFQPQTTEGDVPVEDVMLAADPEDIVCHHFKPINDIAKSAREDQVSNPENFIRQNADLGTIAEFMVDAGFYEDEMFYDDKRGEYKIRKPAKRIAMESIRDTIGEHTYRALLNGEQDAKEHSKREDAIKVLSALGSSDKETRGELIKMLTDAGITKGYFRGAPVDKLAGFVYDKGLYKA